MLNIENNIITQIYRDESLIEKKSLFEYVKDLTNTYINSLNNEMEKTYLNNEDNRMLDEIKTFKASEFGMLLENKSILRVGNCLRQLYFQVTGAISDNREISEIETIERNMLVKKQWLEKLQRLQILECPEKKIMKFNSYNIESTEDGIIYDASTNKEYALLIKPVNDTAYTIKELIFSKNPKPMLLHIPEVCLNIIILRKPIKLIYVGKNNSDIIQEFNFGAEKNILTVNKEKYLEIDIYNVNEDITNLNYAITKEIVPPRSYEKKELFQEEVESLYAYDLINNKEAAKYLNGEEFENFRCKSCRYAKLCNSIDKGWVKS